MLLTMAADSTDTRARHGDLKAQNERRNACR